MVSIRVRTLALPLLLGATLLATACHKKAEEPANQSNAVEVPLPPPPPPVENEAKPEPKPKPTALVPPDDYKLSTEEQVREDAEATGMTSRSRPSDTTPDSEPSTSGNSSH